MRKIYIYLISLPLLFLSCQSDLLDTAPYDEAASESMWLTEPLADKGVLGVYSGLNQTEVQKNIATIEGLGPTGNMVWNYGWNGILTGRAVASIGFFSDFWKEHYELISNANDAVANLPKAPLTDEKMARLISESKFLRAYAYYRLNTVYQGVPVYLTPTKYNEFTKGRETAEAVWNVIIDDLTDCINNPSLPLKYNAKNTDYGRVTKGAAYALRGKVYMWQKKWKEAEADLRKVKDCGYDLFQGNFGDLFREANEQCSEMIFSFQCIDETGYGSMMSRYYGSSITHHRDINEVVPNTDFADTYQWKDGREFNWDDVFPGYNDMTPNQRRVFFLRDNLTPDEITAMEKAGADMSKYLPTENEARILKVYADRDPRLTETMITPYSSFLGVSKSVPTSFSLRWPYRTSNNAPFDIQTNSNSNFYYLFRKFVGEGYLPHLNRENASIDIPIIRYAGVLLDLAEALNEQGKTTEAITYVNLVRQRAKVADLNSAAHIKVTGQDDLRQRLKEERRWEFAGEGQCLFEDLRWGAETYKASKFFEGAGCKQIWGATTQFTTSWSDRVMKWAIPASEVQRNSNIIQNTGWES